MVSENKEAECHVYSGTCFLKKIHFFRSRPQLLAPWGTDLANDMVNAEGQFCGFDSIAILMATGS